MGVLWRYHAARQIYFHSWIILLFCPKAKDYTQLIKFFFWYSSVLKVLINTTNGAFTERFKWLALQLIRITADSILYFLETSKQVFCELFEVLKSKSNIFSFYKITIFLRNPVHLIFEAKWVCVNFPTSKHFNLPGLLSVLWINAQHLVSVHSFVVHELPFAPHNWTTLLYSCVTQTNVVNPTRLLSAPLALVNVSFSDISPNCIS